MLTFEELLKACSSGEMPQVFVDDTIRGASSNVGTVVCIKKQNVSNWHTQGCAVHFPGMKYTIWFNAVTETDKRSRYMAELTLLR